MPDVEETINDRLHTIQPIDGYDIEGQKEAARIRSENAEYKEGEVSEMVIGREAQTDRKYRNDGALTPEHQQVEDGVDTDNPFATDAQRSGKAATSLNDQGNMQGSGPNPQSPEDARLENNEAELSETKQVSREHRSISEAKTPYLYR